MNGISQRACSNSLIFEIRFLSDELKQKIKDELVIICHGENAQDSKSKYHSTKEIVKALNHRLSSTDEKRKIGLVGELLLNVLIREFTDIRIISPFFNLEESNVKKGFDIIATSKNGDLWFIESKAGQLGYKRNVTEKICERIHEAGNDLDRRLNMHNSQLWFNAINSVRNALRDKDDEKAAIMEILGDASNSSVSSDKKVILGGAVFCLFNSTIEKDAIIKLHHSIMASKKFSDLKIIAIQKRTYQTLVDFLLELGQEENP